MFWHSLWLKQRRSTSTSQTDVLVEATLLFTTTAPHRTLIARFVKENGGSPRSLCIINDEIR